MENNHGTAYKRHKGFVHQRRREKIIKEVYGDKDNKALEKPHKLNKGKIHCSCPLCTDKVKNGGFKHSDKVNMCKGQDLEDYTDDDFLEAPEGTITYTTSFVNERSEQD